MNKPTVYIISVLKVDSGLSFRSTTFLLIKFLRQINSVWKKYLLEITWLYHKYLKILFRGNWEGPGFIRNALHFGMK